MRKPFWYKLDGVRPVPDETNGLWMQQNRDARRVAFTQITDDIEVSTVFLGLDHNFGDGDKPVLFETLVFGGPMNGYMDRYENWFEAEQGHQEIVDKVRKNMNPE
jgi:hypothetical protein